MKKTFKLLVALLMLLSLTVSACSCAILNIIADTIQSDDTMQSDDAIQSDKCGEFYNLVCDNTELLDALANDTRSNWYDAIYEDAFDSDINKAVDAAFEKHEQTIADIKANDSEIKALYKEVKDGKYTYYVKDVMDAYSEYYITVLEAGGSYNTYTFDIDYAAENLSKALRKLYVEL